MTQVAPNWRQFFQVNNEYSMRNLTVFITIIVSSAVVAWLARDGVISSEIFAAYLLAGGGVYSFGKWQDDKTQRSKIDAGSEPDTNLTTINQPEKVNVSGDSVRFAATRKPKRRK